MALVGINDNPAHPKAGVAYCWGYNTYGQLGIGTTTDKYIPTKVGGNW